MIELLSELLGLGSIPETEDGPYERIADLGFARKVLVGMIAEGVNQGIAASFNK